MFLRCCLFLLLLVPAFSNAQSVSAAGNSCETVYDSSLCRTYYKFVDEPPTYIGGTEAMLKTLQQHIRYRAVDRDTYFSGTVWLSFIVEPNGTISNIRLLKKSNDPYYNAEALRVAAYLTSWNPGKCNGVAVTVLQYLPVKFLAP